MTIFQTTVLRKYIKAHEDQNSELLYNAYQTYKGYYLNPEIQNNIRNSKEEQFQEGFLRELFVKILGYTISPDPNYNIKTEQKNEQDSKKADGAIIIADEVRAVIELKGLKTTNLKKIEEQAFGYKTSHKNCPYIITSNFEKLRFYIDNKTEYEEFNLFNLSQEGFVKLHLLLSYGSIKSNLPQRIKNESTNREDEITTQLYKDYSLFKRELFDDIVALNPEYDKLILFRKSQKLLDRLLFIFFAEDKGLLPPNSIQRTVDKWEVYLKDPLTSEKQKLYDRFKLYFNLMNTGNKELGIFAYNGGLFAPDTLLNNIAISDNTLKKHVSHLANYDFASEVDVNILGHIFENSLSEIENVTAEITTGEKPTSKRKKDGVFYTPRYITTYIVEKTVGLLCTEKKVELQIKDKEYTTDKRRQKATSKKLADKLKVYREWLLSLTICDPACGSGAFLNAALDFLIAEHKYIDELSTSLSGGSIVFSDIETSILENNLFGVDINDESVEIARLSLWLRTARPQRKLNTLSNNIKCGNSLISVSNVVEDKAFDWETEFPQVFVNGGFDVVVGNPPYIFARENFSSREKKYYAEQYSSAKYQVNTYMLFMERSIQIIKKRGYWGLIIPNSWLMIYSAEELRRYILSHCNLEYIVNLYGKSFEDANVETVISIGRKELSENNTIQILKTNEKIKEFDFLHSKKQIDLHKNSGLEFNIFANDISTKIIEKLKVNSHELDSICSVKAGLQAYEKGKGEPKQSAEDVKNRPYDYFYKYNQDTYQYLDGSDVGRYNIKWSGLWLWYGNHLAAPRTFNLFSGEKIILREITGKYPHCLISTYTTDLYLYNRSNIAIINRVGFDVSLKYINTMLNSSLMSYYFTKNTAKAERKLFPKIILNDLRKFPIKYIANNDQQPFIVLADKILEQNKLLSEKRKKFLHRVLSSFEGLKKTVALERFDEGKFKDFVTQLKKQKIKLSLSQQDEWEEYFTAYKTECQALVEIITITDCQIDQMVYTLYNLTTDEIEIIAK